MNTSMLVRVCGVAGLCAAGWYVAEGLTGPSHAELLAEGRELFQHEWTVNDPLSLGGDGLGPVFNAKSCVACHFQGGVGGGGGLQSNVTSFQVLPNRNHHDLISGVVHTSATLSEYQETEAQVRRQYPEIPSSTRVVGGCTERIESFDPLLVEQINTPALFGAGLIDGISSYAIQANAKAQFLGQIVSDFQLDFKTTPQGRVRDHFLGSVGKFGWRGQFVTLEEFVATACAVELGLTNSVRAQDVPRQHEPDQDAVYDMNRRQLQALVEFCRQLPRPEQILPENSDHRSAVLRGEQVFAEVGCTDCHVRDMDGVTQIYSDFLLHSVESDTTVPGYSVELEVPLSSELPEPKEWKTPPLWGVADSAPYFHDGRSATLEDAVTRHSADARYVMKRLNEQKPADRQAMYHFLRSLRAPQVAGGL